MTVNNVTFNQDAQGVLFEFVDASAVNNCQFNGNWGGATGIYDYASAGGNSYNNDAFVGCTYPLSIVSYSPNVIFALDRCEFDQPPSN